jgi:hypothetical protein
MYASNATPVPADYTGTFKITQVKNVSNGNTSTVSKSQAGDKVTVKNGTVVLKNATTAPASSRTIYASADQEIGRFGIGAEAENVTVRKLTVTNGAASTGVTDWTTVISSNSVKLVDVATNSQISATVTVTAGSIVFDSMSAEVTKDTTRNFKVVATTTGFSSGEHGKRIDIAVALNTVDKASGSAATPNPGTLASVSTTDYVLGVVPPTVSITKKSAKVFLVKVTNVDSESDITLNAIKARVKPVAVNNSTYTAIYCLRSEGSSASTCPEVTTSSGTGGVPGVAANLMITTAPTISKNGSSYSYEILVDSNYVDPTDLLGEVLADYLQRIYYWRILFCNSSIIDSVDRRIADYPTFWWDFWCFTCPEMKYDFIIKNPHSHGDFSCFFENDSYYTHVITRPHIGICMRKRDRSWSLL